MRKLSAILLLLVAVGAVLWLNGSPRTPPISPKAADATPMPAAPEVAAVPPVADPPPPLAPRLPGISVNAPNVRTPADPGNPPAASAPSVPRALLTPASAASPDIRTDLEEVLTAIRDFRNSLGGNPVGTNAEITKALLGDNLKQIKIPIPTGSSLNANGELCDRWGTPYFFHQLSRDKMEVRSAGPDRQMWTPDDRQM